MSRTVQKITLAFPQEKLARLKEAKRLFESDTGDRVEMADFIDILVKTYVSYRDKRGASESSLLRKLTK